MMKKAIMTLISMLLLHLLHSTPVDLNVPDLFNGIFDQFSYNFVGTSAAARGHTGVAMPSRIGGATLNPAVYRADDDHFAIEFLIKSSTKDFNTKLFRENGDEINRYWRVNNQLRSSLPFSYIGIGLSPMYDNWNMGISYALTRSLEYDAYERNFHGRPRDVRYPTYNEHQFTFTANKQFGDFTVGLNSMLISQVFKEYRNEGSRGIHDLSELSLRFQIGALYEFEAFKIGISYTPKTSQSFRSQIKEEISPTEVLTEVVAFDAVSPTNLAVGTVFSIDPNNRIFYDIELNRYSETSSRLSDQISHKLGYEHDLFDLLLFKAGMIYRPSVFSGDHVIENYVRPDRNEFHPQSDFHSDWIARHGTYKNTDMLLFTFGVTLNLMRATNLHIAAMVDMMDNVERSQVMVGIDMDFSALERRR
jgi:hypothetical protein